VQQHVASLLSCCTCSYALACNVALLYMHLPTGLAWWMQELNGAFSGLPILVGGCAMLVRQLGSAAWAGIAAILLVAPVAGIIMAKFDTHNTARLEVADKRVELLSELLNGIRMVKAFAWEPEQTARVEMQRDKELSSIRKIGICNTVLMLCFMTMSTVASLCAFAVYTGVQGNTLTASTAFVSLTLFQMIQMPLIMVPFML
jgi:ABC-type bacteriocin/lantibiotic exporter with double-glycine peptidase domain